jgi:hypothetical protein
VAGVAIAGTIGGVLLALRLAKPSAKPVTPVQPQNYGTEWFGSPADNADAIAAMIASENPEGSYLLWSLQAAAANNFARRLGRAYPSYIKSIGDMLQSGIVKGKGQRLFALGWGPQYNPQTNVTRFASTSAMRRGIPRRFTDFALALIQGRLDIWALRGRRGEALPKGADPRQITSFLQIAHFAATVRAQGGGESDPAKVVARWGNPPLIVEVEGVRFYGRA